MIGTKLPRFLAVVYIDDAAYIKY